MLGKVTRREWEISGRGGVMLEWMERKKIKKRVRGRD